MSCTITMILSGQGGVPQSIIAARAEHDAIIEGYTVERLTMNGKPLNTVGILNPVPVTMRVIREAVARGWTTPGNSAKVMDTDLAFAIASEVYTTLEPKQRAQPKPKVDSTGQFEVSVFENGKLVRPPQTIDDPFVNTRVVPKGFRAAWKVLWGELVFQVQVRGKHNAVYRAVMGADYTPDAPLVRGSYQGDTRAPRP